MNTEPINVSQLTPEQKKALKQQLIEEQRAEKAREKANKKAFKDLSIEFLEKQIEPLIDRQQSMEKLISDLFREYKPILELKKQIFGADVEAQESHTVTHPEGHSSITIGHNANIVFDGTESAGVQMIKDFLMTLPGDDQGSQKLSKAVNVLLKPNGKTGMLNPGRIIQLNEMREEFGSETFNKAVDIITEAQHKVRSSMYVSGWKLIELEDGRRKRVEFRFTV